MLFIFAIMRYVTIINTHLRHTNIVHPEGESMKVGFDGGIKLEFHSAKVTSNGGFLAYRDLDHVLELFDSVSAVFIDKHTGRNIQHDYPIS